MERKKESVAISRVPMVSWVQLVGVSLLHRGCNDTRGKHRGHQCRWRPNTPLAKGDFVW